MLGFLSRTSNNFYTRNTNPSDVPLPKQYIKGILPMRGTYINAHSPNMPDSLSNTLIQVPHKDITDPGPT